MNNIRQRLARRFAALHTESNETGSIAILVVGIVLMLILLTGLAVDSSGKFAADEHAQQIAADAARSAANSIGGNTVQTGTLDIDGAAAQQAGQSYLAASGMTGTVTVSGNVVTVTAKTDYTTKFLSILFINTLPASGTASAQLITQ